MRKMGAAAAKIKLISCKMKSHKILFVVICTSETDYNLESQ